MLSRNFGSLLSELGSRSYLQGQSRLEMSESFELTCSFWPRQNATQKSFMKLFTGVVGGLSKTLFVSSTVWHNKLDS